MLVWDCIIYEYGIAYMLNMKGISTFILQVLPFVEILVWKCIIVIVCIFFYVIWLINN